MLTQMLYFKLFSKTIANRVCANISSKIHIEAQLQVDFMMFSQQCSLKCACSRNASENDEFILSYQWYVWAIRVPLVSLGAEIIDRHASLDVSNVCMRLNRSKDDGWEL